MRKKNRGLIDECAVVQLPPSTTSLVRGSMVARTALANFTAALRCATRCRHNANMSTITATSAFSETLPHSPPPAPLPSPSSSPFPPPFNHVNSFRFSITRTCTRTPPFAHPLPALACRIPVGPFLLGTCPPTERVHITHSYYEDEDVCRHSHIHIAPSLLQMGPQMFGVSCMPRHAPNQGQPSVWPLA